MSVTVTDPNTPQFHQRWRVPASGSGRPGAWRGARRAKGTQASDEHTGCRTVRPETLFAQGFVTTLGGSRFHDCEGVVPGDVTTEPLASQARLSFPSGCSGCEMGGSRPVELPAPRLSNSWPVASRHPASARVDWVENAGV